VCGYSIVQAESADEAARIFGEDQQPLSQMPGPMIDVIEIMEMPGFLGRLPRRDEVGPPTPPRL